MVNEGLPSHLLTLYSWRTKDSGSVKVLTMTISAVANHPTNKQLVRMAAILTAASSLMELLATCITSVSLLS